METDTWSDDQLAQAQAEYEAKLAGLQNKLNSAQIIGGNTAAMEALKFQAKITKIKRDRERRNAAVAKSTEGDAVKTMTSRAMTNQGLKAAGREPIMASPVSAQRSGPIMAQPGVMSPPAPQAASGEDFFAGFDTGQADVGVMGGAGEVGQAGQRGGVMQPPPGYYGSEEVGGRGQTLYDTPAPSLLSNAPGPRARTSVLGVTPPWQRFDQVAPEPLSPAERDIDMAVYITKIGIRGLMADPHNLPLADAQRQYQDAILQLESFKRQDVVPSGIPGSGTSAAGQGAPAAPVSQPTYQDIPYGGQTPIQIGAGGVPTSKPTEVPRGGWVPAAPPTPATIGAVSQAPGDTTPPGYTPSTPGRPEMFIAPMGGGFYGTKFTRTAPAGPGTYGGFKAEGSAEWKAKVKTFNEHRKAAADQERVVRGLERQANPFQPAIEAGRKKAAAIARVKNLSRAQQAALEGQFTGAATAKQAEQRERSQTRWEEQDARDEKRHDARILSEMDKLEKAKPGANKEVYRVEAERIVGQRKPLPKPKWMQAEERLEAEREKLTAAQRRLERVRQGLPPEEEAKAAPGGFASLVKWLTTGRATPGQGAAPAAAAPVGAAIAATPEQVESLRKAAQSTNPQKAAAAKAKLAELGY